MKLIWSWLLPIGLILPMIGCGPGYLPQPDDPRYAPIIPEVADIAEPKDGSVFVGDAGLSLYQDIKAHKIGDIITVKLTESTKASKDAKLNFKREYDLDIKPPKIFGITTPKFSVDKIPFIKHSRQRRTFENKIESDSEFKGVGDSGQNNSLTGEITVTVVQIFPNKNLLIKGEKWITLNQGAEYIRLSGIIRPRDIGPTNEVLSTRIANARISYSGTGTMSNSSRAGWLSKFFNSPLMPI